MQKNKPSRKPSKREILAFTVLVLIVVVGLVGKEISKAADETKSNAIIQNLNHTYQIGEEVIINSEEDEALQENGQSYPASIDWMGTMSITLNSAVHYNTAEGSLFVCSLTVKSINAVPRSETASGISAFNISVFDFNVADFYIALFDGTVEAAAPDEMYWYYLAPGESNTYQVGYRPYDETDFNTPSSLHIGVAYTNKYVIEIPEWEEGGDFDASALQ